MQGWGILRGGRLEGGMKGRLRIYEDEIRNERFFYRDGIQVYEEDLIPQDEEGEDESQEDSDA